MTSNRDDLLALVAGAERDMVMLCDQIEYYRRKVDQLTDELHEVADLLAEYQDELGRIESAA